MSMNSIDNKYLPSCIPDKECYFLIFDLFMQFLEGKANSWIRFLECILGGSTYNASFAHS